MDYNQTLCIKRIINLNIKRCLETWRHANRNGRQLQVAIISIVRVKKKKLFIIFIFQI